MTTDGEPTDQHRQTTDATRGATTRRRLIAGLTAAGVSLTGCLGGSSGKESAHDDSGTTGEGEPTTGGGTATTDESTTATGGSETASLSHATAADLRAEPRMGPAIGESEGVIVAFEDPTCPACRRFEEDVFPKLVERLIQPGTASFFFRTFPHVQGWARPATRLLEATYAADESAFWTLKGQYFAQQDSFSTDNVYAETESFLSSETALDAASVVEEARNGAYDSRIESDMNVVAEAGVESTPSFFLFDGTKFVTKVVGSQSVDVFANALGV